MVTNPISGHSWPEETPLNKWTLYARSGIPLNDYRTYKAASKALEEQGAFELKFFGPLVKEPLRRAR
jgi:hypothetical protein